MGKRAPEQVVNNGFWPKGPKIDVFLTAFPVLWFPVFVFF